MEETQTQQPMVKYAATYGLILGLALVLLFIIGYIFHEQGKSTLLSLLNYAVAIGGIAGLTIMYRDKVLGGYITYGQAVGFGVTLAIFAYFILGVVNVIVNIADPAFVARQLEDAADQLLQMGYPEELIEQSMRMTRFMINPFIVIFSSVFIGAVVGTIVSLITSIFIQRKKSIF